MPDFIPHSGLCLLSGFEVRAQSAQRKFVVRGRVTDEAGTPLVGVTVVEHGTSNGVATLSGGEFSIGVPPGAVLDVSCVGYVPRSVPTENRTGLDITLEEDVKAIADVIVTALGLERNYADLTYSADKIKGTQLTNVKSSNMILSLAGKSAGVQVNESSSGAGASSKVSIRGVRSVASDNHPLYVVDGMPILNSSPEQAYTAIGGVADAGNRDGGDGISNLNAEDIESVSILKGAPAAALYGSQAANGVILIQTRTAKGGSTQVSVNHRTTIGQFTDKLNVWRNPLQMAQIANEELTNAGLPALYTGQYNNGTYYPSLIEIQQGKWSNTDWADLCMRTAVVNNTTATLSHSTDKAAINLSLNYFDDEGVYKKDNFRKGNVTLNGSYKLAKNFTLQTSNILSIHKRHVNNTLEYGRNP